MPYADQQDMEDYFGSAEVLIASDRDGDGTADTDVIGTALNRATSKMDSYIAAQYTLPLQISPLPDVLVECCCDLAMYSMSVSSTSLTEDKQKRYDNCVKWLLLLSTRKVVLDIVEEAEVVDDFVEKVSATTEPRLFTRTKMRGLM